MLHTQMKLIMQNRLDKLVETGMKDPAAFERELEALSKITLPLTLFSIRDILAPPGKMEFKWETRTGSQWLDLVDDLKEQEEYDDEYF